MAQNDQKIRQDLSIGKNIKRLRKELGMTQNQVVAKMQLMGIDTISRSIYSQIEGGTYNIRVSEIAALKNIFRLSSYDEFFKGIGDRQSSCESG